MLCSYRRRGWWLSSLAASCMQLSAACSSNVDESLEGKRCTPDRRCLPGWVCNEKQLCVRSLTSESGGAGGKGERAGQGGQPSESGRTASANVHDAGTSSQPDAGVCPADSSECAGKCVKLASDPAHCGACETSCVAAAGGTARCSSGRCTTECPSGALECSGQCVATNTPEHCGDCDACPAGASCDDGVCSVVCQAPSTACAGVCSDLQTDPLHCGSCSTACTVGGASLCSAGLCINPCDPGLSACSGSCVDLMTSQEHCGSCERACPVVDSGTASCRLGDCNLACNFGFTLCSGQCVSNVYASRASQRGLGSLGVCAAFEAVNAFVCMTGQTLCGSVCVDLMGDHDQCGACGTKCAAAEICKAGLCAAP